MNKIIFMLTMFVVAMACNRNGTSIKVNKTAVRYELLAEYPVKKQVRLNKYLKAVMKKDSLLLKNTGDAGREIRLSNGATFYLKHNAGKLEMEMLKEKNNAKGLQFFDVITNEIRNALN